MLRTKRVNRKAALKAAWAYAGQTMENWCAEQGITPGHLYQVLGGKRESARLVAVIDEYIAKHTPTASAA